MKKSLCIILVLFVMWILFIRPSRTYQFPNPPEDIISIDLLINENEMGNVDTSKLVFQRRLSAEEAASFMDEIYGLETRRCYPPTWGWGEYIAKVTYSNGDVELLGSDNIEYVKKGGQATGCGPYSFWVYGVFEEVFSRYMK